MEAEEAKAAGKADTTDELQKKTFVWFIVAFVHL
jgi:hypothetical protein